MQNFMKFLLAAAMLILLPNAWGQAYPTLKPVRIIVAAGAGSGSDVSARMFADLLSRATGQKFVVENRAGGGGNIGLVAGARAAPDGYTLVLGNLGGNVLNQFLYSSLDFDPEKDFEPIIQLAGLPFLICVTPSFPANSIAELVAAAKEKPNSINIAIDSTSVRVIHELYKLGTGSQLFPISYNGPTAAIADTLSGRVPVLIETLGALRSFVSSGKLKALAITTRKSSELMPEVKSMVELGYPNFGEYVGWVAFMAPKGTPREVITLINTEMNKIIALPDTRRRLAELGFEAKSGSPQDLADFVASERARFGPIIRAANIKAE